MQVIDDLLMESSSKSGFSASVLTGLVVGFIALAAADNANGQVPRKHPLPDFYTRPYVSPYVDLLRRNDRRDFLRYDRNVVPDVKARQSFLDLQRGERELDKKIADQRLQVEDNFRKDREALKEELQKEALEIGVAPKMAPAIRSNRQPFGPPPRLRATGFTPSRGSTGGRYGGR